MKNLQIRTGTSPTGKVIIEVVDMAKGSGIILAREASREEAREKAHLILAELCSDVRPANSSDNDPF